MDEKKMYNSSSNETDKRKSRFLFRNISLDKRKMLSKNGKGATVLGSGLGIMYLLNLSFGNSPQMTKEEEWDMVKQIFDEEREEKSDLQEPNLESEILASSPESEIEDVLEQVANPESKEILDSQSHATTSSEEVVIIYTEAPFAFSVNDEMSQSEAYKIAREEVGEGGFYEWRGNTYNTYNKEEWESMTNEQQESYIASIDQQTNYDQAEVVPTDDVYKEEAVFSEPIDPPLSTEELTATEEAGQTGNSEMIEVEYSANIIAGDFDKNGVVDTYGKDTDGDNFIDVVEFDFNEDGEIDTTYVDSDGNETLDAIIIDTADGQQELASMKSGVTLKADDLSETLEDDLDNEDLDSEDSEDIAFH